MGFKDFAEFFRLKTEATSQARVDAKFAATVSHRERECDDLIKVLNSQFEKTNKKLRAVK